MGRKKKDSVTRCFNIDKNIFNLLEYLTEDGFLTLTQAIEKSIKGRFIHEFGQEEFNKIIGKETTNKKNELNEIEKGSSQNFFAQKNKLTEQEKKEKEKKEAEEFEKLKEARRLRKLGDSND